MSTLRSFAILSAMGLAGSLVSTHAMAGTVIYNTGDPTTATVALGVNDDGSLNTDPNITTNASATGLAFRPSTTALWVDGTSPGCLCEGWGVSAGGDSGYANIFSDGGPNNLTFGAPTGVTGSTVTTAASLASLPGLTVTQEYGPSASSALFVNRVTISNGTGGDLTDVRYVRVMDWDIHPNEFNELVTIKGTGTTTLLEQSSDNGFNTADPLGSVYPTDPGDYYCGGATTVDVDFTDVGPCDHGAYFRFNFGSLADGESYSFDIFYGAAGSEADALAALSVVGPELYSLGQWSGDPTGGTPGTYIFAFKGVGGPVIVGPVPEIDAVAGTGALSFLGFVLALVGERRRKAAA